LLIWRFLPRLISRVVPGKIARLGIVLLISLLFWLALSYGEIELIQFILSNYDKEHNKTGPLSTFEISAIFFAAYFVLALVFVIFIELPLGRKGDGVVGWKTHLARFLLGALSNIAVIVLSELNEYVSGVTITFPAVILSALCSLWLTHSETMAISSSVPMILGSASTSLYSLIFVWAFPHIENSFLGTLGSLFVTLAASWFVVFYCYSLPSAIILRKKELYSIETVPHVLLFDSDSQGNFNIGSNGLGLELTTESGSGGNNLMIQDL